MPPRSRHNHAPALSLVEVVISAALVSVLLVAALTTVAASGQNQLVALQQTRAHQLVASMLAELLPRPLEDPDGPDPVDVGATRTRIHFDDIRDYDGWSASPPTDRDGNPLPGYEEWTRAVTITEVSLVGGNLSQIGADGNVLAIEITVSFDDHEIWSLQTVRCNW